MRILLKNGKIYDGTGSDPVFGDILVEDEKIVAVGPCLEEKADETIDLEGLSISSGFFDAHSHNDWFAIKKEPLKYFEPFIRQGITSFITGNCGLSAVGFDADSPHVDKVGGGLFGYRGVVADNQDALVESLDDEALRRQAFEVHAIGFCNAAIAEDNQIFIFVKYIFVIR